MKLTVDASVVIKWFVTEPLCEEARQLLGDRLDLHAPDILLAEFANIIWKKVRRGEISRTHSRTLTSSRVFPRSSPFIPAATSLGVPRRSPW